jgi:annexin A7/11
MTPFDPRQDAEILRKAMKGFGTDEQAIINVVTRRSNSQRQEIVVQFKAMYGKVSTCNIQSVAQSLKDFSRLFEYSQDLLSNLKSELSGKFEDLVIALMTPLPVFLAKELQYAIEGIGTNEQTLIEILCTASNAEIFAIKNVYRQGKTFHRFH